MSKPKPESVDGRMNDSRPSEPEDQGVSNAASLCQNQQCHNVEIPLDREGEIATTLPASPKGYHTDPTMYPISPINLSDSSHTLAYTQPLKHLYDPPSSPGSTSQIIPRIHSPASSIFERNVQEDILPAQPSPSIPSHIRTENHIPPVLEASSAAIADDHTDPDHIEIITNNIRSTSAADAPSPQSLPSAWPGDTAVNSSYSGKACLLHGVSDTTDLRRLSFISFADVVNAENAETEEHLSGSDSFQVGLTPGNTGMATLQNRSPSPLSSPTFSCGLSTSPPTSILASFKGLEASLSHRGVCDTVSPLSLNPSGEISAEAKRKFLKDRRSKEMSSLRSRASSTGGNDGISGNTST